MDYIAKRARSALPRTSMATLGRGPARAKRDDAEQTQLRLVNTITKRSIGQPPAKGSWPINSTGYATWKIIYQRFCVWPLLTEVLSQTAGLRRFTPPRSVFDHCQRRWTDLPVDMWIRTTLGVERDVRFSNYDPSLTINLTVNKSKLGFESSTERMAFRMSTFLHWSK